MKKALNGTTQVVYLPQRNVLFKKKFDKEHVKLEQYSNQWHTFISNVILKRDTTCNYRTKKYNVIEQPASVTKQEMPQENLEAHKL